MIVVLSQHAVVMDKSLLCGLRLRAKVNCMWKIQQWSVLSFPWTVNFISEHPDSATLSMRRQQCRLLALESAGIFTSLYC